MWTEARELEKIAAMATPKRITLQDIADALGVSRGTVDRVLHGRGRVSAETRERIEQKTKELGYVPNRSARMLATQRSLRFAVLHPIRPEWFFRVISTGIASARDELLGYGVVVEERTTTAHDWNEQQRQLLEVIEEGFDGIALVPAHRTRLNRAIAAAVEAGVPVVTFNSDAPESERALFVGQDLYRAGRVAGELLGRFIKGERVALLTGFTDVWAHEERVRGILDSLTDYFPHIRVSGPFEFQDDDTRAERLADEIVDRDPKIAGFVSTTGTGHRAVARVLLRRNLSGVIQNIGYDIDDEIRALMRQDAIQASIGQDPFSQGYHAVRLLFHLLTQNELPAQVFNTKIEIVLQSNLDMTPRENDPRARMLSRTAVL